ncbi:hypothetical protein K469DRAFT_749209 [Zopfia rhizophila CBS 207.26]|uniref:Protein NO VEIN C-terminal domain-containing protein n=1 Tax=Zopfia rhizophila CBS 207.26 TaxID=1314779 RepID=A0A6A6EAC3_9PEZI|nr:hypothetical protein K469DRAFT_749209 [Zopfia rhizophila CBS 207.26]
MESHDREDADEFIRKVARGNGWVSDENRKRLQNTMPDVLESIDGAQDIARHSTEAYNADDNNYSIAKEAGDLPSLIFSVSKDRIILDSNENGFTEANVRAICTVGESTKPSTKGYIGEKGIGFKSVFIVSRKVHVQSGPFSFAFNYNQPNGGLGMVTPLVEDRGNLPSGIRTRIILHLKSDKRNLFKDFESLPDTLLLFLQNLKKLTIRLERPGSAIVEKKYLLTSTKQRACVHIRMGNNPTSHNFWIARRTITDMPEEETRAATEKRERIEAAEVVLAFPIDHGEAPIIEDQHVFAFLPLQKVGFKFLIQSDFITQASREGVADCPWNVRLLDEIVTLFVDTIDNFLQHDTLKYQWIRYLSTENVPDEFWTQLQKKLLEKLKTVDKFICANEMECFPEYLRFVPNALRDHIQDPLIPDCDCEDHDEMYVSEEYDQILDHPILRKLGVTDLTMKEFIHRLASDVKLGEDESLWKCAPIEDVWHEELATVLLKAMNQSSEDKSQIGKIPLVPLTNTNRKWVPPRGACIFFPTCRGIEIPTDLNLSLVDPHRLRWSGVVELFKCLGVSECEPERIFPEIKHACQSSEWGLKTAVEHLKFIFWNHDRLATQQNPVMVVSAAKTKFWPHKTGTGWIYRPGIEGDYSAADIIDQPLPMELKSKIFFLHPLYYETFKNCERRQDKTGIEWLEEFLDVKVIPQLQRRSNRDQLSFEVDYIARHKPQQLLGLLKANWSQVRRLASWQKDFKALNVQVPILDSDTKLLLRETYLPLPKLRTIVARLDLEKDFGFIQELQDINDDNVGEWRFLSQLGVGVEEDLNFWIHILKKARQAQEMDVTVTSEIYSQLQRLCVIEEHESLLRSLFSVPSTSSPNATGSRGLFGTPLADSAPTEQTDYVFFPKNKWRKLSNCVWNAPDWYGHRERISSESKYKNLGHLFKNVLNVLPEPTTARYLDYLVHLKKPNLEPYRTLKVRNIYEALDSMAENDSQLSESIKTRFENCELVYNFKMKTWYSPSDCIWADNQIQLPSKFSVATQYSTLQSFFCDMLGITTPKLDTHIQGLIEVANSYPSAETIKRMIRNICHFNPTREQLNGLLDCKCFPVTLSNGALDWMDSKGNFAIVDRREYGRLFAGKVNLLEFSLEEVHFSETFLRGLNLQKQYMSCLADAKTTATNSVFDERLTEDLRRKAYAICRYIVHYEVAPARQGPQQLFQTLQTVDIYVTDTISKKLSIRQNNDTVTVTAETSNLHLEEVEEKLRLYVPKDPERRSKCMARELPLTLLKHLGAARGSIGDLASILLTKQLAVIDSILEDAGIIGIDGVERSEDNDEADLRTLQDEINEELGVSAPLNQTQVHIRRQHLSPNERSDYFGLTYSQAVPSNSGYYSTPATSVSDILGAGENQDKLYERFLAAIVDGAKSLSGIPHRDRIKFSSVSSSDLVINEIESAVVGSRDFKIGAAGELFVFEWLKGLELPRFGLGNWQSKIRHFIRAHHDYHNLENWHGSEETSDIVYDDCEGKLTTLLIDHAYLNSTHWTGRHPTYYIEVKATPSSLNAPFFVRSKQYGLMESMILPEDGVSENVYLVARVFNLGLPEMGLKLYLDPASLRRDRRLLFKPNKYEVTPAVMF